VIQSWIELREYATTNAFASFDNLNAKPSPLEIQCGRNSGDAGAKNEDVRGHEFGRV